ncbi:MAG: hypothetical protein FIB04_05920 [Gammaproteobacteria bacterium]|nr:hypothetical protein [Gammaproteobacteria bacterium]
MVEAAPLHARSLHTHGQRRRHASARRWSVHRLQEHLFFARQLFLQARVRHGDGPLRHRDRLQGKARDATAQVGHEVIYFARGQRPVDVSVPLRELRRKIPAAQYDLERASAPEQPRKPHGSTCTRDDPDPDFGLAQDAAADLGKPHVAGERQFATAAPAAALDLGDGRLGHRAEAIQDAMHPAQPLGASRRCLRQPGDDVDVGVRDEELRIGALQDHDLYRCVRFEHLADAVEVRQHRHVHEVERAVVERDDRHACVDGQAQRLQSLLAHVGSPATAAALSAP